jgi:hypothetical protein
LTKPIGCLLAVYWRDWRNGQRGFGGGRPQGLFPWKNPGHRPRFFTLPKLAPKLKGTPTPRTSWPLTNSMDCDIMYLNDISIFDIV